MRGESPDLPGGTILVDAIESTIRKSSPTPVEFYVEIVETGRFSIGTYEEELAALIADKYADVPLDLVVAFSQAAVEFTVRERPLLFPRTPLLLGMIDAAMLPPTTLPPGASAVYAQIDAPGTIALAQRLYPAGRRVLVVGGTSRFDRGWQRAVRAQLRGLDPAVPIAYDVDSSLVDLTRRVSQLPPDTIVLYVTMTRDASDLPERPTDALETLRSASTVPIFSLSSTYIGHGALGGAVLDFVRHGEDLGRQAARMMEGAVPPPMTTAGVQMVDARELQRFHISESRLPPSTVLAFVEPTLWEEEKGTILVAAAVVLAQTGLIVALVRTGGRRRATQRRLLKRLEFEQLLSEFSLSITAVPPHGITAALDRALGGLSAALELDGAWRWRADEHEWDSSLLRAGRSATFAAAAELPSTIRERSGLAAGASCSMCAVPVLAGDGIHRAIFWRSRDPLIWQGIAGQLQMVSAVMGTVLQRRTADRALAGSDDLKSAILDSLPAHVAVLDRDGVVIAVNGAWTRFGAENGVATDIAVGVGSSYLQICQRAAAADSTDAAEAADLIAKACRGEPSPGALEYRCDAPDAARWFLMRAEPLRRAEGGAVVTHWDITQRKQNEIALSESEHRFRRLADALPIPVWMSDSEGGCIYWNEPWLQMTGRTIDQERGQGWFESVHAADRAACMEAYFRAFHRRVGFQAEYRVRRHDGEYRWVVMTGVPRYGTEGTFHGYVGGGFDVSERKDGEHLLRGLSHRLMAAQDDERRRIARELHDHLSQQLALLAIDLQQLAVHPPSAPEALATSLQDAWRRTTEVASDVHSISHRLHPSKMEALGLVATIRAHCRDVSRQSLAVQFHDQDVPVGISAERALGLFRVLEEALSNATRHSGAKSAQVALGCVDGHLILRVGDDGRGFPVEQRGGGIGLVSMRERIEALDGVLSITSEAGRGTVVEARVPLAAKPQPRMAVDAILAARAESA